MVDTAPPPRSGTHDEAPPHRTTKIIVAVLAAVALLLGHWTFWFLTDDAFIAFRYISNSMAGHGWVWNPPPFRPVDGYTSLGWVALLEAIWRVTGIEPPRSANPVALVFAFGQLALLLGMLWRIAIPATLERVRPWLVVLATVGVLSNRTFLAWTSSGLETSMFDFMILLWIHVTVWRRPASPWWPVELVAVATCAALTRPDGMLYLGSSIAIVLLDLVASRGPAESRALRLRKALAPVAGLVAIAIYLAWHHAAYGALMPNTYYAKVTRSWPEAGWRWLASFVLEYALVWWIGAMSLVAGVAAAQAWRARPWARPTFTRLCAALAAVAPAATIAAHVGYYTLVVGGDHFEYRVLTPLVPLAFITMVWALGRLRASPRRALAVLAAFVVTSWILPWTHWFATRNLATRDEAGALFEPVAPHLPAAVRWYARPFDDLQQWLIQRMICMRHQEHKVFYEHKVATLPPREIGQSIGPEDFPTLAAGEAGYIGWVLPNVAIIDAFGLSDYFVARNPEHTAMMMAHARRAPPGYLEAFEANVVAEGGAWIALPRRRPLRAEDIVAIERRYDVWLANLR